MATPTVILDTNILIDFFRKQNNTKSVLYQLQNQYEFSVSIITVFEFEISIKTEQHYNEYQILMKNIVALPLDQLCITHAVMLYKTLKSQNTLVELADLLIGATAICYDYPLITLNHKHFVNMPNLTLIDLP